MVAAATPASASGSLGAACSVFGCSAPAKVRGWCGKHYQRWLKHGDPSVVKQGGRPRVHGTNSGYTGGCRCAPCRKAHADANRSYERRYKGRRAFVDAAPSRQMISCLLSFGVGAGRISKAMGKAHRGKPRIRTPQVRATTAEAIGDLHWGLWRTHGPFRKHCGCAVPDEVRAWLEAS